MVFCSGVIPVLRHHTISASHTASTLCTGLAFFVKLHTTAHANSNRRTSSGQVHILLLQYVQVKVSTKKVSEVGVTGI